MFLIDSIKYFNEAFMSGERMVQKYFTVCAVHAMGVEGRWLKFHMFFKARNDS